MTVLAPDRVLSTAGITASRARPISAPQPLVMKRLILVGGGHAHLEVLRAASRRPFRRAEVLLVSPHPEHHYSSMVPGYLQRDYREAELTFDLAALSRVAGATFRCAAASRIDAEGRWVEVAGERIEADLVSVDVGAVPAGADEVPGARDHAATVRPMTRAVELRRRLDALVADPDAAPRAVVVVGGGAAGVEVALAAARRIAEGVGPGTVTLVERETRLLGEYAAHVRARVARLLAERGIEVITGRAVVDVTARSARLHDGRVLPAGLVVWLTGAAPSPLLGASALALDPRGFMRVDATLRAVEGGAVWGAGDCISLEGYPNLPKAGVYAVREAPVLAHNLRVAIEGGTPRRYVPQPHFLALLNTADGHALLRWHGLTSHSRWAWALKNAIDRRFVRRYQRLVPAGRSPEGA